MISNKGLLYIEPTQPAASVPVLDHLTRMMTAAFRKAGPTGRYWGGVHECVCGAFSRNRDYRLPNGEATNSLCVHYLAHHRPEIPADQLVRVAAFLEGEAEPTAEELQGPDLVLAKTRAEIEESLGPNGLDTWTRWGLDVNALSRNLRDGCLPGTGGRGFSAARLDAQDLLHLLSSIETDALVCVRAVVEQEHPDVRKWGEQALRIPGWDRSLWVAPLLAVIQRCRGMARRSIACRLWLLGPAAAAAAPTLRELAKKETGDGDYQYDLSAALSGLDRTLGV